MPPYTSLERSIANHDLSIEYTSCEDTFEVYLTQPPLCLKEEPSPAEEAVNKPRHISAFFDDREIFALIEGRQWDDVIAMVLYDEDIASSALHNEFSEFFAGEKIRGNMVLHEACKKQPPLEVVKCLLAANPEVASVKGDWGYLPLHFACETGASAKVIKRLLKAHPGAITVREDYNRLLPIHLACQHGSSKEVLEVLVTHYPEAVNMRDGLAQLPMSYTRAILNSNDRRKLTECLDRGPMLCATSKATTARLEEGFEKRRQDLEDGHTKTIDDVKTSHQEVVGKISNDLLDAEFNNMQLKQEIEEEKATMEVLKRHCEHQLANLGTNLEKLQEDSQLRSTALDTNHEKEVEIVNEKLSLYQRKAYLLNVELAAKKAKIKRMEQDLENQKEVHKAMLRSEHLHFQRLHAQSLGREEELKKQIESLKKSNDLKHRLIHRITSMAQEQKQTASELVKGLVSRLSEQCVEIYIDLTTMNSPYSQDRKVRVADI